MVSVQWGIYIISTDTLLFSVQLGINHYIDTIAESLGFLMQWGIAGCINEQYREQCSAVRNRSKCLVLSRVWVTKYKPLKKALFHSTMGHK